MSSNTVDLVNRGMKCLREGLGDIESEEFIAIIIREKFNYTEWQRTLYGGMNILGILDAAEKYEEMHPFRGGL